MSRRFGLVVCAIWAAVSCGGDGGNGPPTITAVTVSGDSIVVLNGTRTLSATAFAGSQSLTQGVTFQWTSSNTMVATVSTSGVVTGLLRDTVTITAEAVLSGTATGVRGQHRVRVRIGSIVITPAAPTLASLGDTVALAAQARDAGNAPVAGVTFAWTSLDDAVATVIPFSGVVTAQANGTARIVASADGVADTVTATVQQVAVSLDIQQTDTTVDRIAATFTPVVTAEDANGYAMVGSAIAWVSRDQAVATVGTDGLVTSVNEGSTWIVASSGMLADSVEFLVELVYASARIAVDSIILTPLDTAFINQFQGARDLAPIVRDPGNIVVPSPAVVWTLKEGVIASIDAATGLITGGAQTGTDTVFLEARTARDTAILVIRQLVATVDVTPDGPDDLHFVGDSQPFAAVARDAGGFAIPGKVFTWTSTDPTKVIVEPGPDSTTVATAQANGDADVRATVDGKAGSETITVFRIPSSAALSPSNFDPFSAFGDTVRAGCVVEDSAGVQMVGHPCNWFATTSGVITFTPSSGASTRIQAVGNGSTTVRAEAAAGINGFNFVVVQQVAAALSLHPRTIDTSRVLVAGTFALVDSVLDANAFRIDTAEVVFTSRNTGVVTVDPATGVVTGVGTGATYVVAQHDTVVDSAFVRVEGTPITLGGDVQPFFNSCAGCHTGPTEPVLPSGMNLGTGASHPNTVDVPALQSALKRILAGNPDSSYLVHKVQGTHLLAPSSGSGVRMPAGCEPNFCLDRGTINKIRTWILQGAQNN